MVKVRTSSRKRKYTPSSQTESIVELSPSRPLIAQTKSTSASGQSLPLQASLARAQRFGHNLAQVAIYPGDRTAPTTIQTKLTVGEPGDHYEQEADRVATQVVDRMEAVDDLAPRKKRHAEDETTHSITQNIQPSMTKI